MKNHEKENSKPYENLATGVSLGMLFGLLINNLVLGLGLGLVFGSIHKIRGITE